jgi:glycosyltransferase involved in cell wall biosynthesis
MLASVVMTVFNGEDYLQDSIQSVINQSFKEFEYLIVNDGSTDRTREILSGIRDERIKIYHLDTNHGAANGLNFAISKAKGKWIFVQDADDISLPERIEEQLNYLFHNPDTVALSSLVHCIPGKKPVSKELLQDYPKYWNSIILSDDIDREIYYRTPFCHGSTVFSKDAFIKAGRYNPKFRIAYDYDLLSRMNELGEFKKIPKVLYHYRIRKDSLAHKNVLITFNEAMIISGNYINKRCFNKKPKIFFFGSATAYPNFIQNVAPNLNMAIYEYSSDEKEENFSRVYELFQKKEIDGIVFLVTNHFNQAKIDYFTNKNITFNRQVFRFYSLL